VIAYCDTLNNLLSALDTAVILAADTGAGAGYLSGNNIYGDLAKAESFSVPDTGYYITSATIFFGAVAINPTDTNNTVNINVWDNTGNSFLGDSAPGNVLNFTVVTLGEIAQAVTEHKGLEVYFPASASLAVDNLFVGVVLPTTAGDTVAIETNTYNGPDGNGWELNASGAWETYNYDWDVTPGSLGNYIIADICNAAPTPPTASFNSTSSSSCSPDTVTFADATTTTTTGYSFSWTFGDGGTANVQNPTYTYAAGGSYIVSEMVSVDTSSVVQVLVPGGGTVSILSSPVVMTNVLVADSENAGVGVADVSISGGSGYYLVTWSTGSFGDTVSAVTAGEYYATVTDQNTCVVTDSVYVPAVYGTGIVELSAGQQVKIYPIPASDVLTLQWSQRSDADITIVDLNGNVITSLLSYGDMSTVVHVGTLAAGNYVIRITDRTSDKQQSLTFSKL
jgi:PKD repeat protein